MNKVVEIKEALDLLSVPDKAEFFPRFFKTGKGEYGEGDVFIGVTVPEQRRVAKEFWKHTSLDDIASLLNSPIHEHRLTALFILIFHYEKAESLDRKKEIANFYLAHTSRINNWDLVDASCYKILGQYAYEQQEEAILYRLADSDNMWEKRIAVVATLYFIKKKKFELTKHLVLQNMQHKHDLMHKANGWMLRELGKQNEEELKDFLIKNYQQMPRTTLRYAIERLDESLRQDFLKGRV